MPLAVQYALGVASSAARWRDRTITVGLKCRP